MTYGRVTEEERTLIYRWGQEGQRQSETARRLARNPCSISREFVRNTGMRGSGPNRPKPSDQASGDSRIRCGPMPRRGQVQTPQHLEAAGRGVGGPGQ
ncbi:MAG: helix-turn-helix domain-containing protein [Kiritimatiellae bacterium]|nr:helix-turn-helix domain-containing protein [Kiritimatiellia bacterium]